MSTAAKKGASSKVSKKKIPAPLPAAAKPKTTAAPTALQTFHSSHAHLFPRRPKNFGIGQALPPKRDLTRFVRWPRYIRVQRQRAILNRRLKIPPAIHQFTRAIDKNQAQTLFRLLAHYRPESDVEKKTRLKAKAELEAQNKASNEQTPATKPFFIKYGLNHVTDLVETKRAKLVVIAHDVDPIELVVWLPALCRKMNVPYCIIKGKARLGHLVYKKTTSVIALTDVRKEDVQKLEQFIGNIRLQFNDETVMRRRWGGGVVGPKAQAVVRKRERTIQKEIASKH